MADNDPDKDEERRRFEEVSRKVLNKQHDGKRARRAGSLDDSVIVHIPRPKLHAIVDEAIDPGTGNFARKSSSVEPIDKEVSQLTQGPVRNNWTGSQNIPYADYDSDVAQNANLRASDSALFRQPPQLERRSSRPLANLTPPPDYETAIHDPVADTNLDDEQEVEAAMKLSSVGFRTETLEREGTLIGLEELNAETDIPDPPSYKGLKKKKKKRSKIKRQGDVAMDEGETSVVTTSFQPHADASPPRSLPPIGHSQPQHWHKASDVYTAVRFMPPAPSGAEVAEKPKRLSAEFTEDNNASARVDVERAESLPDSGDDNFLSRLKKRLTTRRVVIASIIIMAVLGGIIFLAIFPPSFVYLDYHLIALKYNKITGTVDRSMTYYGGCYLLGPSTGFKEFTASAHTISLTKGVFTSDRLPITITYHLQYFIKPDELGELHRDYSYDYNAVLISIVDSEIKNLATPFTVDEFRLRRAYIENYFHGKIKTRLSGDCCDSCCPSSCTNNTVCSSCRPSGSCNKAYHVKVPYFQLSAVDIPAVITERYLQRTLLQVEAEAEYFKQEYKVEVKQTQRQVNDLTNTAKEITQAGNAKAAKIKVVSEASREGNITDAYVSALGDMYSTLNIAQENHKLSIFMIRALEDQAVKGNLYRGYNYNTSSLWTSPPT